MYIYITIIIYIYDNNNIYIFIYIWIYLFKYIYSNTNLNIYTYIYPRGPKAKLCHLHPTKDILCTANPGHACHGCVTATGPLCWCFVRLTHFFPLRCTLPIIRGILRTDSASGSTRPRFKSNMSNWFQVIGSDPIMFAHEALIAEKKQLDTPFHA